MSKASVRERLAASFPFHEVSQPRITELAFPPVLAQSTVSSQFGSSDGTGSQILQATLKAASDAVTQNNKHLADLQSTQQQLLASTNENIQALKSNTATKGNSGPSRLSTIGSVASGLFGQGSLLSPLIGGLFSLFGGANTSPAPLFTPFVAPSPVQLQTVLTGPATPSIQPSASTSASAPESTKAASQVQVQVNAIDSKSFIDHSDAIAEAVRQALLNSHALGDVIAGF